MQSLGLAGDGDEIKLIQDVELAFAFKFEDADLIKARTVGDLAAPLWSPLQAHSRQNTRCMSLMAFYALRQSLECVRKRSRRSQKWEPVFRKDAREIKRLGFVCDSVKSKQTLKDYATNRRIRPKQRLREIGLSAKALSMQLQRHAQLNLPHKPTGWGYVDAVLQIVWVALIAGFIALSLKFVAICVTVAVVGFALKKADPGRFDKNESALTLCFVTFSDEKTVPTFSENALA